MATALILGAGLMGSATAWPLSDNGHEVRLVGTHLDHAIIQSCKERNFHPRLQRHLPDRVIPFYLEELEQALSGVDFIVSGVNSTGVRWIGKTLAPFMANGRKIIAVTKGLEANEEGDLLILPEVLRAQLPAEVRQQVSLAAIGGPCIAGELAGRRPTSVLFGSREKQTAQQLAQVFRTDYYHIQVTTEIVALEIAVALKNAYALGVGLAGGRLEKIGGVDAAGAHMHNLAAALFALAASEMRQILEMLKVNSDFAFGLPGAGDLFVTVQGGRTVRLGRLLGQGLSFAQALEAMPGETLESVSIIQQMGWALPKLEARGLLDPRQLPFLRMLIGIIVEGRTAEIDLKRLFA